VRRRALVLAARVRIVGRLQAIAQSSLTYVEDPYVIERYEQIRRVLSE
jgi:Hydrolase of X-linked nucleoside diphosphate N terminal